MNNRSLEKRRANGIIDNKLDLKTSTLTSPPSVAATLLSDSLFPPRKPKTNIKQNHNGSSTNTALNDSDSDNDDDDNATSKKDPLATSVWRLYTKAKDTLPNGSRLENLTWRMMAMTLKKKEAAEKARMEQTVKSEVDPDTDMADDSMSDGYYQQDRDNNSTEHKPSSPPPPDDTTTMLSSSAPPYMIDFLGGGPPFQRTPPRPKPSQLKKNVLVYGSARASSPSPPSLSPSPRNGFHLKNRMVDVSILGRG